MNTLVMFVNQQLKPKALTKINKYMQTYKAYVMYAKTGNNYEIVTFYHRIYQLLSTNDFYQEKEMDLINNDEQAQSLGMLELCANFSKKIDKSTIFQ